MLITAATVLFRMIAFFIIFSVQTIINSYFFNFSGSIFIFTRKLVFLYFQCRRKLDSILLLVEILRFQIDCSELLNLLRFRRSIGRLRSNNLFEVTVPRTNVLLASPLHQSIKNYSPVADQFDIFSSTL